MNLKNQGADFPLFVYPVNVLTVHVDIHSECGV